MYLMRQMSSKSKYVYKHFKVNLILWSGHELSNSAQTVKPIIVCNL